MSSGEAPNSMTPFTPPDPSEHIVRLARCLLTRSRTAGRMCTFPDWISFRSGSSVPNEPFENEPSSRDTTMSSVTSRAEWTLP